MRDTSATITLARAEYEALVERSTSDWRIIR